MTQAAVVLLGVLLVSSGHYLTPPSLFLWHNIFQRLYFLPIVFAALSFGWTGGFLAATFSALCYVPHIIMTWRDNPGYTANQYAEIVVFFLVGLLTGVLADRERKRQEELRESAEQLSRVYRELQDSFEHLKRADRLSAVGQLSAGLAHEIRNPLGSIEGAIDILEKDQGSGERQTEFFTIIKKECGRVNRLLTALLDFARPRQPRIQDVNVKAIFEKVAGLVRHGADRQGVLIECRLAANLPAVEGDTEQLEQVILNLALNAVQAMPDGGGVVLAAEQRDSECVIQVMDDGPGVREEDLERIFDPFFTTKPTGTGLGLAVAHQIVTQHGGVMRAERNPDRGMTFSVILPLRRGTQPNR